MRDNRLVLHPADPQAAPDDLPGLVQALEGIGFIGGTLDFRGRRHYRPGEDFLQLVSFLGCSPVVALGEPGATGDDFCHVDVQAPEPAPRFLAGANLKKPRCPGCRYTIEEWPAIIAAWEQDRGGYHWRCPLCGNTYPPPQLNWRQSAGFARMFIEVWGIFEGEAVPGQTLMTCLRQATATEWDFFYCSSR